MACCCAPDAAAADDDDDSEQSNLKRNDKWPSYDESPQGCCSRALTPSLGRQPQLTA
jgi:hypothetical protein